MSQRVKSKKPAARAAVPARAKSQKAGALASEKPAVVDKARAVKSAVGQPAARGKTNRGGVSTSAGQKRGDPDDRQRVAELEAECVRLRSDLAAATAEIERLKQARELVVNRIDWVIDSLHNLVEDEG